MASPASLHPHAFAFNRALNAFKAVLTPEDQDDFKYTVLEDLQMAIREIQTKQGRKSQNLARMKPFLEGMQQYGQIVEVFLNVSNVIGFVWVSELVSFLVDMYGWTFCTTLRGNQGVVKISATLLNVPAG